MSQGESVGYKNQKKIANNSHRHQREHPREMNMRIEYENRSHENNKREFLFHIIYICKFVFMFFYVHCTFSTCLFMKQQSAKKILRFFFFIARKNSIYIFSCNSFIHSVLFCFFGVSHFYRPDLCDKKNIKLS